MEILDVFAYTLIELMQDNGIKYLDIEKMTGISVGNISMWISKKVAPTANALLKLSEFFGCPVDYLLGRKSEKELKNALLVSSLPLRLKSLAAENKKSLHKISTEIKIGETILYRWARGVVLPNLYSLVLLADYFNCSVDYLLGREK